MARAGAFLWLNLVLALLLGGLPLCVCTPCAGEGTILHVAGVHAHHGHAPHEHASHRHDSAPCGHEDGPEHEESTLCGGDAPFASTGPGACVALPSALAAQGSDVLPTAGAPLAERPAPAPDAAADPRTRGLIVLLR